MTKLSDYAVLLIGISFLFLLINKIAFGVSLILGTVILTLSNTKIIVKQSKKVLSNVTRYEILITFFFFIFLFDICFFIN